MGEVRKWNGWVILSRDEEFYRVTIDDPTENEPLMRLLEMGWFAIPVVIVEQIPEPELA